MRDALLVSSIATAIGGATAILVAATGELLVERTGVYNIGLEGVMLAGALAGFLGADATNSWVLGLVIAAVVGAAAATLFGLVTVALRADMVVAGVALVLIMLGLTTTIGQDHVSQQAASRIPDWHIPGLSDIPGVGPALFEQSIMTYLAILLPFAVWFLLDRTRHGLALRSIGENPAAADASGFSVAGWRLAYVAIGGALAGIGGGVLTLGIVGTWQSNVTAGQGWVAFAIVFFAAWRPFGILVGALLFGALSTLGNVGQAEGWAIPSQVFVALPYVGTVLMMIARGWITSRRGGSAPWPAALGTPFYRS
jgi:simple sugar transport system permease protein